MDIKIIRNTTQTLTFPVSGDYSEDTIKFTVKADKTLTSSRLIDKDASVSYSSPTSTITVDLSPADSAGLSSGRYYFDLRVENSITDKALITSGVAYIDKTVRTPTDGLTTDLTEFRVTEVDPDASIPVVHLAYGNIEEGFIGMSGLTANLSCSFADGVITYTHSFGGTNAVIKRVDDTYTYTIITENETTLQIEVRDSEGDLIDAVTENIKYFLNLNVSGVT